MKHIMEMYKSLFDIMSFVTTKATTIITENGIEKARKEHPNLKSYKFSEVLSYLIDNDYCFHQTSIRSAIYDKRSLIEVYGRKLDEEPSINTESIYTIFESMFKYLDNVSTVNIVTVLGKPHIDFVVTKFLQREGVLSKDITVAWNFEDIIDCMQIKEEDYYKSYIGDIILQGSTTGLIKNCRLNNPYLGLSCSIKTFNDTRCFNGMPFKYEAFLRFDGYTDFIHVSKSSIFRMRPFLESDEDYQTEFVVLNKENKEES